MPDYFVFGGCLRSAIEFPELPEARGLAPSWTLEIAPLGDDRGAEPLGELSLSPTCSTRISRRGRTYRYAHSCTGTFEVSDEGRRIVYDPAERAHPDSVRMDVVARVLLLCVEQRSVLWLHGSSVAIDGAAVGFLGPSGAGKSTMGLLLARAGSHPISDDTLPVSVGATIDVWATDYTVRVNDDSRSMIAATMRTLRRDADGKFVLPHAAVGGVAYDRAAVGAPERFPLDALYLMTAASNPERTRTAMATRERVRPMDLVRELMPHVKLGPIVRDSAPAQILFHIAALAERVPVYRLSVHRDLARSGELAAEIMSWHVERGSPAAGMRTRAGDAA
jgi:hypothetical protein